MYPYHNKIKSRIKNGELVRHYYDPNYPGIGPAYILVFRTAPFLRPIRPYRWPEYQKLLEAHHDAG